LERTHQQALFQREGVDHPIRKKKTHGERTQRSLRGVLKRNGITRGVLKRERGVWGLFRLETTKEEKKPTGWNTLGIKILKEASRSPRKSRGESPTTSNKDGVMRGGTLHYGMARQSIAGLYKTRKKVKGRYECSREDIGLSCARAKK